MYKNIYDALIMGMMVDCFHLHLYRKYDCWYDSYDEGTIEIYELGSFRQISWMSNGWPMDPYHDDEH